MSEMKCEYEVRARLATQAVSEMQVRRLRRPSREVASTRLYDRLRVVRANESLFFRFFDRFSGRLHSRFCGRLVTWYTWVRWVRTHVQSMPSMSGRPDDRLEYHVRGRFYSVYSFRCNRYVLCAR